MAEQHVVIKTSSIDTDWAYIAHRSELTDPRPLLPIMIDAEPYVLFLDADGELGLIARHCPHRGADLLFGRLEDGGIRCPFHGWHFDRTGQCQETPAEPEGSIMHRSIRAATIPLREDDGKIYAYIGEETAE